PDRGETTCRGMNMDGAFGAVLGLGQHFQIARTYHAHQHRLEGANRLLSFEAIGQSFQAVRNVCHRDLLMQIAWRAITSYGSVPEVDTARRRLEPDPACCVRPINCGWPGVGLCPDPEGDG